MDTPVRRAKKWIEDKTILPSSNIVLPADLLHDDTQAFQREWLVTNGLGGYASATVSGANTRRYHGLLVAALHPPLGRAVLLSKLEETLEIGVQGEGTPQTYSLSCNLYPGVVHPQGNQTLEAWSAYPAPCWRWSPAPGIRFEKRIWMARGHNTTYIAYRLLEATGVPMVRLNLVPLLAWKDYHSEMRAHAGVLDASWSSATPGALDVTLPGVWNVMARPLNLLLHVLRENGDPFPNAWFTAHPDWYRNFQHPREQERGQSYVEDLYTPGTLSALLHPGETVVICATSEEGPAIAPQEAWKALVQHQEALLRGVDQEDAFIQQLALAADQFVVQVPQGRSTLIAGYPWFSDWGRDTMIALPGLCLSTGRAEVAREILLSFAEYVNQGMLPNRFPDHGATPEYNTVDATLWYFVALYRYCEETGDFTLGSETLWAVLEQIIGCHLKGTRYNIHVDPEDNLLYAGEAGSQLTWMDAKVGDWVVTPRTGKPVEINALWVNALYTMAHLAMHKGDIQAADHYETLAKQARESFVTRFPRPDGHGLYDVLDTPQNNAPDGSVRPNQIFALSLPFAPIAPDSPIANRILDAVHGELLTPFGLRTLSLYDPAYRPRYEGDNWQRDGAYHQGTVWPWLLGAYLEAHVKVRHDRASALELQEALREQFTTYGMGTLAEIFDGSAPQRPNGCIGQAWSIAEILRTRKALLSAS